MIHTIFNQLIIKITPWLPRAFVWAIAGRYVAGVTHEAALAAVKDLNNKGFSVTLDILGEHTQSAEAANAITNEYTDLFREINHLGLDCNISLKPSHIGLDISEDCVRDNLMNLLKAAEDSGNFLRIDMESSAVTDQTISLYNYCRNHYQEVGTVFQAYLLRTENDLNNLPKNASTNFRLCKGIYRELPEIAIQERRKININYLKLLQFAFKNNIYVGIATHDLDLLTSCYKMIDEFNISTNRFEFQVLYGVPMGGWLERHLENNYKVRVYVPFGEDWYAYSIRRVKENPNIAGYILKNIFRR